MPSDVQQYIVVCQPDAILSSGSKLDDESCCCDVIDHVTSSDQSDCELPVILVDMSDSVVDSNFQFRLSSFMTKTFTETNETPTLADLPSFLEHYTGLSEDGKRISDGKGSSGTSFDAVPITPSALADCLSTQRTAHERLRSAVLKPALQQLPAADDKSATSRRPSMAELARSQRLKRVVDVLQDTMKIEKEIHRVWSTETVADPLKQSLRRRTVTSIERETKTLSEQTEVPSRRAHSSSSGDVTSSALDGRCVELIVYHCHEAVEKILRALLDLGATIRVSTDDKQLMMEFDAIGKRRTGSTASSESGGPLSPSSLAPPTLVNYTTAIDSLLAALPTKYNLDALTAISATRLIREEE